MRDYRKEQFINRFKNANITRAEAERKYKLKIEEEERMEMERRIFEAMNSRALQEALQFGGASAAVGGNVESYRVSGDNIFVFFKSETTLTYQVVAFNYTDNKISGPTDLKVSSDSDFYWSGPAQGGGSLAFGQGSGYTWYAYLDVNGAIIKSEILDDIDNWDMYDGEGRNLAFYYIKGNILYLNWWTSQNTTIHTCEFDCGGGFNLSGASYDDTMEDGTINGYDNNNRYWSFLPNGEYYDITDSINKEGNYIERYSVYTYSDFYAVFYNTDSPFAYTGIRIVTNKGVILQDIDLTSDYTFNCYQYGYYGENKYFVRLWNCDDNSVPYYYVVYNGNTDTVITKESSRGTNFESGIVYRTGFGRGYEEVADRLTNGDVIIFAPDDGDDVGYDGKMDGYYYTKFHALIGDSNQFIDYAHTNDGVESFRYKTSLIYSGNPAFIVKQENSDYIKILIFKSSGAELHVTDINYNDVQSDTLSVYTMGDNIWVESYISSQWHFKIYNKNGSLIDTLIVNGNPNWDVNGSSAIVVDSSANKTYYATANSDGFNETPSYYFHWDTVHSCTNSEDNTLYPNFFAYGEGYTTATPASIVSANGISTEITLADSSSGTWNSWVMPNQAVWLAKNGDNIYTITVYKLDGTLLQHVNLGVDTINNSFVLGDRIWLQSIVGDYSKMWMLSGSEIEYTEAITSSEQNNWSYVISNDWTFGDCN
jgi:hypothetical protein